MRRWVLTGPAGAGKSALCGFLAARGAAIVQGDLLGHEILRREDIIEAVRNEFGSQVIIEGAVDRTALGVVVFADPTALDRLNRLTHTPLSELARRKLGDLEKGGEHLLAVFEAAIYFLLPPVPDVDLVITLTAPEDTRLERLVARGGLTRLGAKLRIGAQRHLEDGWNRAEVILTNEGPLSRLEEAAEKLWMRLKD
jgi:dephospho-CoA kinase